MNPKELANVLVKILGLSVILHGIPNIISTLIFVLAGLRGRKEEIAIHLLTSLIGYGIQIAVGMTLIRSSKKAVGFLFKGDSEQV